MAYEKGTKNSHPIIQDSAAPGVPITDYGDDTGDIIASNAAWIANNKIHLDAVAGLTATDGVFVVGNGTTFVAESGATARTSLGLGTLATITPTGTPSATTFLNGENAYVSIPGGGDMLSSNSLSDVASAETARENLGLAIGTDVQAYSTHLAAVAALDKTDGGLVVTNGTTFVVESGSTARTTLGLGTLATQNTVSDDNWSGADLAVTNGGTGSSTASGARTNLGLVIGTDVQAYDAHLAAIVAQRTNGTIISRPSMTTYPPSANTDAARGTALATALAAFAAGSDTKLELSEDHTYEVATALAATISREATICNGTIKANASSDLDYVLRIVNNGSEEDQVILDKMTIDHNNCTRDAGTGDTVYITGTGPIRFQNGTIKNGANDPTDIADGSLIRTEGYGIKEVINTRLIDAAYSTWRAHARVTVLRDVWSICHTAKTNAYQRHGYCDSEAQNVNMLKLEIENFHVIDTVAHKVNTNIDPSTDGPTWLEELYIKGLWDISTSHTNPDDDYFLKLNYVRRAHLQNVVQRHSTIDTISTGNYVEQRNTSSIEGFLNLGICELVTIENCRFDGSIKGIGSGTIQCQNLIVRQSVIGENADIYEALGNVSNFGQVLWEDNSIKNVIGRTAGSRCVFDMTDSDTTGSMLILRGRNYIHTNFPTASGQTGALIRAAPLTVGQVGIDPIIQEYQAGSMTWVQAFSEEERLAVTAYSNDLLTLHLSRNVKKGGPLRAIGTGSGVYTTTQQQPAGSADYFPDITGVPGAVIWNDDPSNGAAAAYFWNGTEWDLTLV